MNVLGQSEWTAFHSWRKTNPTAGADAFAFIESALAPIPARMLRLRKPQGGWDDAHTVSQLLLDLGIYLRERDFLSLGVEWWNRPVVENEGSSPVKVDCIPFEGEVPCLYSLRRVTDTTSDQVLHTITLEVLALVDHLSRMNGSGLGILVCPRPSQNDIPSGIRVDPRTGRRLRYKITPYASDDYGTRLCWIERSETGRGRGHAHGPSPMF